MILLHKTWFGNKESSQACKLSELHESCIISNLLLRSVIDLCKVSTWGWWYYFFWRNNLNWARSDIVSVLHTLSMCFWNASLEVDHMFQSLAFAFILHFMLDSAWLKRLATAKSWSYWSPLLQLWRHTAFSIVILCYRLESATGSQPVLTQSNTFSTCFNSRISCLLAYGYWFMNVH